MDVGKLNFTPDMLKNMKGPLFSGHQNLVWFRWNLDFDIAILSDLSLHLFEVGMGDYSLNKYIHPLEIPHLDILSYIRSGTISVKVENYTRPAILNGEKWSCE